jgi:hypothetical protein
MSHYRSLPLVLGAAIALSAAGVAAAASTVTPPAGTPNLAATVLQPSDLAAGSTAEAQSYFAPAAGSGFTAQYSIEYSNVASTDGVRYSNVTDTVGIGPSSTAAARLLAFEQHVLGTAAGHKEVARVFVKTTPKRDHPTLSDVKFSDAASAGVGSESVIETITYTVKRTKIQQVLVVFIDGDAYNALTLTGVPNRTVPQADGVALSTSVDAHLDATLSGSTGATGVTGTTG